MSVVRSLSRVKKFVEGILPVQDRFPKPVFDQPAFQVDRLLCWWRQLYPVTGGPSADAEDFALPVSGCLQTSTTF